MSESNERRTAAGPESALARAQAEYAGFAAGFRSVVLATVGADGAPLASYAPCVVDDARRIVCFVSSMSEHASTLAATRRASAMFLEDEAAAAQVFARRRLTYACSVELFDRDAPGFAPLAAAFVARFGDVAAQITSMADFRAVRLTPVSGRFVIGFGAAYAIDGGDLDTLVPLRGAGHGHASAGHGHGRPHGSASTPLGADGRLPPAAEARIVEHMNGDHADALLRYARVLGRRPDAGAARMLALDARGFDLRIASGAGEETLRIPFEPPLRTLEDAHAALVRLAQETREER